MTAADDRSETRATEPIALVDMDGTLCDYDGAMSQELATLRAPGEAEAARDAPHIEARRNLIKRQPGFWRALPPLSLGFDVLGELRALEFEIHILTKGPSSVPAAWQEKVEWCLEHVPDIMVTVTSDKGLVYGRVLVDDYPPYFERWLQWRPRGLVVVPAQAWNVDYATAGPNHVRYDGSNLDEVRERLTAVRQRGDYSK